jgi:hypothetical protein
MAKRRTREEKIKANEAIGENKLVTAGNFYVHDYSLSTGLLVRDLTKSLIVTILAMTILISLAVYLNRGGWSVVNNMMQKLLTVK